MSQRESFFFKNQKQIIIFTTPGVELPSIDRQALEIFVTLELDLKKLNMY